MKKQLKGLLKKCKRLEFNDAEENMGYQEKKKEYEKLLVRKKREYLDERLEDITLAKDPETFWKALKFVRKKKKSN